MSDRIYLNICQNLLKHLLERERNLAEFQRNLRSVVVKLALLDFSSFPGSSWPPELCTSLITKSLPWPRHHQEQDLREVCRAGGAPGQRPSPNHYTAGSKNQGQSNSSQPTNENTPLITVSPLKSTQETSPKKDTFPKTSLRQSHQTCSSPVTTRHSPKPFHHGLWNSWLARHGGSCL